MTHPTLALLVPLVTAQTSLPFPSASSVPHVMPVFEVPNYLQNHFAFVSFLLYNFCFTGTGGVQRPPIFCFPGHYCPVGTMFPTQHKCPAGTWSDRSGLESERECQSCPRGWYCLAGVGSPSGKCNSGHYCSEGTKAVWNICMFFHLEERHVKGMYHSKMKILSLATTFVHFKTQIYFWWNERTFWPCIDSNFWKTIEQSDWSLDVLYMFISTGTLYGSQHPCPPGTYSTNIGNGGKEDCQVCPEGYYCKEGTSKPTSCPPWVTVPLAEITKIKPDKISVYLTYPICPGQHFVG